MRSNLTKNNDIVYRGSNPIRRAEQYAGRRNVLNLFPGRGTLSVKKRGEVEA